MRNGATVRLAAALPLAACGWLTTGCSLRYEVAPGDIPRVCRVGQGEASSARVFHPTSGSAHLPAVDAVGGTSFVVTRSDGERSRVEAWTFDLQPERTYYLRRTDGAEFAIDHPVCTASGISGNQVADAGVRTFVSRGNPSVDWKELAGIEVSRVHGGRTTGLLIPLAAVLLLVITSAASSR